MRSRRTFGIGLPYVLPGLFLAILVAACNSVATTPGQGASASSGLSTFAMAPVPGNSVAAPLPTDAPATVKGLAGLPSCGGQVLFEADPDISPPPTPPLPVSAPAANSQGANCLIWDWENDQPGQLAVSAISDEQDEIYTLYRLTGDGTVDVVTRVKSHPDQSVTWTDETCRQLSLQGDQVTPADCTTEKPLNQ